MASPETTKDRSHYGPLPSRTGTAIPDEPPGFLHLRSFVAGLVLGAVIPIGAWCLVLSATGLKMELIHG